METGDSRSEQVNLIRSRITPPFCDFSRLFVAKFPAWVSETTAAGRRTVHNALVGNLRPET
jgi:hypothetical protein